MRYICSQRASLVRVRRLSWVDVLPMQIDRVEVGLVGISVTVQIVRAGTCDMEASTAACNELQP